jgi:hypothetical protein
LVFDGTASKGGHKKLKLVLKKTSQSNEKDKRKLLKNCLIAFSITVYELVSHDQK